MTDRARRRRSSAVPAAILSAVWLGGFTLAASADTFTWNGNTGNFSDPVQWAGGVAPSGLNPFDVLNFGGSSAYTATNDIAAGVAQPAFYFGTLTLAATIDGSSIVAGGAGNPGTYPQQTMLRAVTSGATINQNGTGSFMVAQPISIAGNATLTVNVAPGAGTLYLADLANPTVLESNGIFGSGTLVINSQSSNPVYVANLGSFPGSVSVNAGVVRAADSATTTTLAATPGTGGGDTLHGQTLVTVAAGATFDLNGNGETMGGISGAGTIQLGATGGIGQNYTADLTWNGTIAQLAGGTGQVSKSIGSGNTTYTFGGDNTYTGRTNVEAGTLRLTGAGKLSGTANIVISSGGAMVLDNTSQNVNDRINPAATLTGISGTFSLIGAPGVTTTQSLGAVTVGGSSGDTVFNVVNGSGGGTATLTVASMDRTGRGTFANFTGSGSVIVQTAPLQINGILGYATVNLADWATVDGGTGKVVPLATYQTSSDPAAWAATDNVKVTGPLVGSAANGADQTINSLLIASNETITIGQSLRLDAGGILATSSANVTGGSIFGGQAASSELVVAVTSGNTLTINSNIVNTVTNGVVKAGPGKLVLGGTNTHTSSTRVLEGTLSISSASNLPNAGSLFLNGGTLEITADVTYARPVAVSASEATIDTGPYTLTLTNTVGGTASNRNDGNLTKRGSGALVLQNVSTGSGLFNSTGNLTILEGTVRTGQGNTFDNGTLITVAAGAVLDLSYDTSAEDLGAIEGAGDVYGSAAAGVVWNGGSWASITFSGRVMPYTSGAPALTGVSVTKSSPGSLTLSGASTYTGDTLVTNGNLVLAVDAMPNVPGPFGNAATPVLVGGTGANDLGNPALYIGAAGVTLGRDVTVQANAVAYGTPTIGATHTSGSSTFAGAVLLGRSAELSVVAGGTTSLTGIVSGAGSLHKVNGGTAILLGANTHSGGTIVSAGTLTVTQPTGIGTGPVVINGGTLSAAAGMAAPIAPASVAISGAGTLDLNDNDMVLDYTTGSPLAAVKAAVASARNGGVWNQPGITSTSAKNNASGTTTLAVAEAGDIGVTLFGGLAVDGTAVLVKYTYNGDANLDGSVNADDYVRIDRGLAMGLSATWTNGDFNYSGSITSADYLLIDQAFVLQGAGLDPAFLADREARFGSDYVAALVASVPEPGSVGILAAVGLAGLARRRRRQG